MGLFTKRETDFVDLTAMRKRGILKGNSSRENNDDIIDLSSPSSFSNTSPTSTDSGNFGFLSNLASADNSQESGSYTERLKAARFGPNAELKNLKVKMEDIEYKLDRFLERLEKIEGKLG